MGVLLASWASVVLLVAGLLLRRLRRAQTTDPGFETTYALALSLDLRLHRYQEATAEASGGVCPSKCWLSPASRLPAWWKWCPLETAMMTTSLSVAPLRKELLFVLTNDNGDSSR